MKRSRPKAHKVARRAPRSASQPSGSRPRLQRVYYFEGNRVLDSGDVPEGDSSE